MALPFLVILLRLVVPFSILKWPLPGIIASSLADIFDWKFAHVTSKIQDAHYQFLDKSLDLYFWFFALTATVKWKDRPSRLIAFGLFLMRFVGHLFFFLTQDRIWLFFFPNFFENFFIASEISLLLFKKPLPVKSRPFSVVLFIFLCLPKFIHEYFAHFLEKQPWELYNIGHMFGLTGIAEEYANTTIWGISFYVLPLIVILLLTFTMRKKR